MLTKETQLAWSKFHSKRLLMNDRSPTIVPTKHCHLSQCCAACMCTRPKLIAFLICVYFWIKEANRNQTSLNVYTPHTAIDDGVQQNRRRKYAMVKRTNETERRSTFKKKLSNPSKNVGNQVKSVHLEEKKNAWKATRKISPQFSRCKARSCETLI